MKKVLMVAAGTMALAMASQANAAFVITTGSFGSSGGVHSTAGLSASTVTGTVGAGDVVTLTSVGAVDVIDTSGGGESVFAAHDGSLQGITVTFTGNYDEVTFDLFKPQGGTNGHPLSNWTLAVNGVALSLGALNPLGDNTNKFTVTGTAGSQVHSLAFTFDPGVQDIREIRVANTVNGVITQPGVPEPATWAMMLAGFGGMGALLRRRRQQLAAATA